MFFLSVCMNICYIRYINHFMFVADIFPYSLTFFFFLGGAALGLLCCAPAFSSCDERGLLFIAVWWLLLWQSTGSRRVGFCSCGARAQ